MMSSNGRRSYLRKPIEIGCEPYNNCFVKRLIVSFFPAANIRALSSVLLTGYYSLRLS